jgi:hypothetical protein
MPVIEIRKNVLLRLLPMKAYFVHFFLLLATLLLFAEVQEAHAQKIGYGFGLGGMSYSGDLQPAYRIDQNRLGGTAFFKYNLDHPISFRLGISAGGLKGEDDARDILSSTRAASFGGLVLDAMAVAEYQFFDLRQKYPPFGFSPYIFGGLGGYYLSAEDGLENDYQVSGVHIPFGAGLRFLLNPKWHLDIEFSPRRTFNAGLDRLFEPGGMQFTGGNPHKSDWFYYLGVNLTYTVFKINCPILPY